MTIINRSRTIRPSSRKETSISYKVDVKKVSVDDILIVTVAHESKPEKHIYRFSGKNIKGKKSIHLKVHDGEICWVNVIPEETICV